LVNEGLQGLKGTIAKRTTSTHSLTDAHRIGWKLSHDRNKEFAECGFTEGKGSRKYFGALLLAAYRNGKLRYFGHSGTGFSQKGMRETIERLKPLFTDKPIVAVVNGLCRIAL
jgi:bifunctional non-homologous end joining protein LigD